MSIFFSARSKELEVGKAYKPSSIPAKQPDGVMAENPPSYVWSGVAQDEAVYLGSFLGYNYFEITKNLRFPSLIGALMYWRQEE